jgi:dTDP-4-amino-4,6-dideoxygalactose transaminase
MEIYSKLEKEFAEFIGTKYAVSVNTGTAALHITLSALGIGRGDEVCVPNFTFISTAWAVTYTGAKPVFYNSIEDIKTTNKTKAIIVAHIYGVPENMDYVKKIAGDIPIIEDACEAHGATFKGKKVGSIGLAGCFSFQASKIINSEEGGIITVNDKELADKIRIMKSTANDGNYRHSMLAFNYRMPNATASLALKSLRGVKTNLKKRERIWKWFHSVLGEYGKEWVAGQVAWVYPLYVDVPFGRRFFQAMTSQPMYGNKKNTYTGRVLPINPNMTKKQTVELAKKIKDEIKKTGYSGNA